MTYKNFGTPSQRGTKLNGTAGEYNTSSVYYQQRVNDLYMHLPPFGNGTANLVSWTPAYKRVPPSSADGFPSKVATLTLTLEEATTNPKTVAQLSTAGLTLYYKLVDQSSTPSDDSTTREEIVTAGKFTQGGTVGTLSSSPRPGSTFGFPNNYGFCMGLKMGDAAPDTSFNGLYRYYIVNNNPGNEKEIVWRMHFAIGFTYEIAAGVGIGTGMTLGGNDIVIENPATPNNGIGFGTTITLDANPPWYTIPRRLTITPTPPGKTADNYFINYANSPLSFAQGGVGTDPSTTNLLGLDDARPYKLDPTPLT
jgi:hypothetical protein